MQMRGRDFPGREGGTMPPTDGDRSAGGRVWGVLAYLQNRYNVATIMTSLEKRG